MVHEAYVMYPAQFLAPPFPLLNFPDYRPTRFVPINVALPLIVAVDSYAKHYVVEICKENMLRYWLKETVRKSIGYVRILYIR